MITSEARPFAKTGGLADVVGALPQALVRLGHRVTIVVPKYRGTHADGAGEAAQVPFGMHEYPVRFIEQTVSDGVTAILIDAPALYDREGLYGDRGGEYGDNAFRFAVLSRGALEYARLQGRRFSVIHAHDWQAGLAPVYARTVLRDDPFVGSGVRTVLTIHNLAFQGAFDPKELAWIGLGADLYNPGVLEFYGRASALKGGVVFSDAITTVSPTYAREILTPDYGFGFDGILRTRADDLSGILNGIDTATWDPASDRFLPVHFDANTLDRKADVKRRLLEEAGLPVDEAARRRPLIGIV